MNQTDKQVTAVEQNSVRATMRAGFTLIEILVAVAIIGILGTVAAYNIPQMLENGRKTAAKSAVDNIYGALTTYSLSHKKYPNDLKALVTAEGDNEPILEGGEGALEDPWGNEYKYEKKGRKAIVISAGPDGEFGNEDDIRSDTVTKAK